MSPRVSARHGSRCATDGPHSTAATPITIAGTVPHPTWAFHHPKIGAVSGEAAEPLRCGVDQRRDEAQMQVRHHERRDHQERRRRLTATASLRPIRTTASLLATRRHPTTVMRDRPMTTDNGPLFCSTALAERIERVEAELITTASEAAHVRAGTAALRDPGRGGRGLLRRGRLADEQSGRSWLSRRAEQCGTSTRSSGSSPRVGVDPQVELANLADPEIGAALTGRGYRLVSFENVLGRALHDTPQPVTPPGVEIRLSDDHAAWLDVVVSGFAHPDAEGVPSHEEFPREIVERRRSRRREGRCHTVSRVLRRCRRRGREHATV